MFIHAVASKSLVPIRQIISQYQPAAFWTVVVPLTVVVKVVQFENHSVSRIHGMKMVPITRTVAINRIYMHATYRNTSNAKSLPHGHSHGVVA